MGENNDKELDKIDSLLRWAEETPGACNGGRAVATDDPDRLGWNVIETRIHEDGVFVFRHLTADDVERVRARVSEWGYDLHTWRVFHGVAGEIAAHRRSSTAPAGYQIAIETNARDETVSEVSGFLKIHGIAPFTARNLSGHAAPSALVTARDADGTLRATAFGYFAFNRFSPWCGTAWCGLVAVDQSARGSGLGRAVNDVSIDTMVNQHGAIGVVEYAAEDNIPSRRMIEGSGLTLRDDIVTAAATTEGTRHTR